MRVAGTSQSQVIQSAAETQQTSQRSRRAEREDIFDAQARPAAVDGSGSARVGAREVVSSRAISGVAVPQSDLEQGMEGPAVKQLQAALVKLGYLSPEAMSSGPGLFGPQTEAALRAFQSAKGVPSTGYYGEMSRAALGKALGPQLPVPQVDLERGSEGKAVRDLQNALVKTGHLSQANMDTGPGEFGPNTEAALMAFQSANGVPSTGYYGPLTRAAMQKALGGGGSSPSPSTGGGLGAPSGTVPRGNITGGFPWSNLNQWDGLILQAAIRHKVDAAMLKAMMAIESGGAASAADPHGAVGLMQVKPQYWQGEASNLGYDLYTAKGQIGMAAAIIGGDVGATQGLAPMDAFLRVYYPTPGYDVPGESGHTPRMYVNDMNHYMGIINAAS
jgi:peptidoglycan hydrolase-like protein with peptidoglycan-binding domain